MDNKATTQQKIILFDGVCNLCNSSVIFILKQERKPIFRFASLQSEAGQELLKWCGLPTDYAQAILLVDNGNIFFGSAAALKIGQALKLPWSLLSYLGFVVPKSIRDWAYSQIAKHRYQWFGKREFCMIPTEHLKARFL
jgi:predicted DCC family thiol-disulfide oxidoreductase YuxK